MSSFQPPRQLSSEQLTSDGETFPELKDVVVKLEEEVDGQYRLLDFTRIPLIILHRTDSVQHCVKMEEDNTDQQLCNHDLPEHLEIKEEHDELEPLQIKVETEISMSKDEDQHVLKQETDTFMVTPFYEEKHQTESRPNNNQLISQDAAKTKTQYLDRSDPGGSGSTEGNGGQKTRGHEDTKKQIGCKKAKKHKLYLCKMCEEKPFRDGLMTKKVKNHRHKSRVSCQNCGTIFCPNFHVSHTGEKPFSCKLCEKSFSFKHVLTSHMSVHTGEKPFPCLICGKSFSRKGNLTTHMKVHTGEKPFLCKFCGKGFGYKRVLANHMSVHTGERPFLCKICGKGFSYKHVLTSHISVHTGEKPFLCTLCGKRFNHKINLSNHMKIHTGEKPYSCKFCEKNFSQKRNLTQHIKVHMGEKPHSCRHCGKSFSLKSHLSQHIKIHTGEKPFCCLLCGKSFSRKDSLTNHMKVHTGEKPFLCKFCGKCFSYRQNLATHMKVHTGENRPVTITHFSG